jgi:hypothetical protein
MLLFKKVNPLIVTGIFRSGKSTISKTLLRTNKFRWIHEPFSNYRGTEHRSTIIKNLNHTFTYINEENAINYQHDIAGLLNHFTYSRRVAMDGGATARKIVSYMGKITLRFAHQWRQPLIDDPFLVLALPWLRETLGWNAVIMTRNPLDFVAVRKEQGFGFDVSHFVRQRELMEGPLLPYAAEVREVAEKTEAISPSMQNAYLWKYSHICVLQYLEKFPEFAFFRFEEMNADGFKMFAKWIGRHYDLDLEVGTNPFNNFGWLKDDVLTDAEKTTVTEITGTVARQIYPSF